MPSGVVTFVSDLYPGSISDKELTRQCGIWTVVTLSWPTEALTWKRILRAGWSKVEYLKGKQQLSECELVETRRIASLRIHVERAMEQLKNFYIFDKPLPTSLTDTANQIFFTCAVLTNFYPPLCT